MIISKLKTLLGNRGCWAILDPRDSSVTLSRRLYQTMGFVEGMENRVIVARVEKNYAFVLNPKLDKNAQMGTIQVNQRLHCVGFETLAPTVARILYDYGLPATVPCKLSVTRHREGDVLYFKFENNEKRIRRMHP